MYILMDHMMYSIVLKVFNKIYYFCENIDDIDKL